MSRQLKYLLVWVVRVVVCVWFGVLGVLAGYDDTVGMSEAKRLLFSSVLGVCSGGMAAGMVWLCTAFLLDKKDE